MISWINSWNYYFGELNVKRHIPENLKNADIIAPEVWRRTVADRIVIIGLNMLDSDQHPTPLSVVSGSAMSGAEIHAQIVAQRLDGNRDMWPAPPSLEWAICIISSILCITGHQSKIFGRNEWLNGVVSFAVVCSVVAILLLIGYDIRSAPLAFAAGTSWTVAPYFSQVFYWLRIGQVT